MDVFPGYPQAVGQTYNSFLRKTMKKGKLWEGLQLGPGWEEQQAVLLWKEIVGENLARLARPLYVEGGVLHLAVASPVVATELRLWQDALLRRLAEVAPKSAVRELKFHLAPSGHPQLPAVQPAAGDIARAEAVVPEDLPQELREKMVRIVSHALAQDRAILQMGGRRCPACGVAFLGEGELCPLCRFCP